MLREDLPEFLRALSAYDGAARTRLALRLAVLTFVRTTELRAARWDEVDLEAAEWRIPAERMKMGAPHIVSLSRHRRDIRRAAFDRRPKRLCVSVSRRRRLHVKQYDAVRNVSDGLPRPRHGSRVPRGGVHPAKRNGISSRLDRTPACP
jgi:integrase